MNNTTRRLIDLVDAARLESGELAVLIEFINEASMDHEASDGCPDYINSRTLGVLMVAASQMTEKLNGINDELADVLVKHLTREGMK